MCRCKQWLPYRMAIVAEILDALHEKPVVGRLVGQVAGKAGKIVPIPQDIRGKFRHRSPGDRGSVRHVKVLVTLRAEAISIPHELFWGDPNMGIVAPGALTKPDRGVYDSFSGWRIMAFHAALPRFLKFGAGGEMGIVAGSALPGGDRLVQKDPWFSSLPEIIVTPVAGGFLVLLSEFPSFFNVATPASLLHRGMKVVGAEHHRWPPLSSLDRKLSSGGARPVIYLNRLPADAQPVEAGNQWGLSLLYGGSFHGTDRFPVHCDPDRSLPFLPDGVQGDHRLRGKGQIRRVEDDWNRCCLRSRESPGKEHDRQRQGQECHVKRTPNGASTFRNALKCDIPGSSIRA